VTIVLRRHIPLPPDLGDLDFLHRPRDHHRLLALEAEDPMAEPAAAAWSGRGRGEDAFPALPYAEAAASATDAAGQLRAALGREAWFTITAVPDERWAPRALWFPAARLYRQANPDDWAPVLVALARDLARCAGS
jgi:hypothetical protein